MKNETATVFPSSRIMLLSGKTEGFSSSEISKMNSYSEQFFIFNNLYCGWRRLPSAIFVFKNLKKAFTADSLSEKQLPFCNCLRGLKSHKSSILVEIRLYVGIMYIDDKIYSDN